MAAGPHFRDDLLRRVDAKARHCGEPLDRILMDAQERFELVVELLQVRLQEV